MKKHVRLPKFLGVCAFLLIIWSLAGVDRRSALAAAESDVNVQIFPGTLVVPALDSAKAILVIQNPTVDQLVNVKISYFPLDRISIELTPPGIAAVPAGGAATCELIVRHNSEILTTDSISLVVQYERQPAGSAPIPNVKVVLLTVTSIGKAPDKSLLAASTKMTDAMVMEKRSGQVYLILQNTTGESLSIDSIEAKHDSSLVVTPDLNMPIVLAPFDQFAIPYIIEMEKESSIQPGKTLVLFNITAHTEDSQLRVLAVATQEVNVGVLGENSLLTLLGVPSLLVLPGFLMVATFLMFWRLKFGTVKIDAKSADFWLIAITLSILAAVIYPPLTNLLTKLDLIEQPRNYLNGYGLVDILALWIASILVATLVFLLVWAIRALIAKVAEKELEARTPSEKDTEYTLLFKMAKQGLGAVCERVTVVTTSDETLQGFLLEPWSEKPEKAWIGPVIKLTWKIDDDEIKDPIKQLLGKTDNTELKKLAKLLSQGKDRNLTLKWSTDSSPKKPRQVLVKTIQKFGSSLPIIQQDLE